MDPQIPGPDIHAVVDGRRERGYADVLRIQRQENMVHGRVETDGDIFNIFACQAPIDLAVFLNIPGFGCFPGPF